MLAATTAIAPARPVPVLPATAAFVEHSDFALSTCASGGYQAYCDHNHFADTTLPATAGNSHMQCGAHHS